jgi:hypothetical protein
MASWILLVHVLAAFALVAGLIGRWITLNRAKASDDIANVTQLVGLAGPFERLVRVGSTVVFLAGLLTVWAQGRPLFSTVSSWLAVALALFLSLIPLIVLLFLPRGRIFERALNDARARGTVTPELAAAFRDPMVRAAHIYEFIVVAAIVALMVLKPF